MVQSQELANLELLNSIILGRDREIANTINWIMILSLVLASLYLISLVTRFYLGVISADIFRESLAVIAFLILLISLLNSVLLKIENRNMINKEVLLNAYSSLIEYFLNPRYSAVVSWLSEQDKEQEINLYPLDKLCEEKDARHFRIIGASGTGKTLFTDWVLRFFTDSQKLSYYSYYYSYYGYYSYHHLLEMNLNYLVGYQQNLSYYAYYYCEDYLSYHSLLH